MLSGMYESRKMKELFTTSRLTLRRPTPEDSLILGDLWRNENVRAFLGGILSEDLIVEKFDTIQTHWDRHGFGMCAVLTKGSKTTIGLCGLHHTDDGLEISYLFFPEYWGNGFAKEAACSALKYGFMTLKEDSIIAITQQANQRSCHLLESIGMKHIHHFDRFEALQCLYKVNHKEYLSLHQPSLSP
jgi:RimJ/RimL family protein N-acetyltransferase